MKRRIKLTFPPDLIKEPIVFTVARQFDITPNIRRARITDTVGEMVLEIDGTDELVDKAVAALREKGVEVELVEGDILQ
ncbi:MAG: NIL domain-containing protein [Nitrospirae bacterium]|nr:NIL domain-containing protein [Nitrospirota bacterium]MBF0534460.1 NIL domain-containing protein [Nitrospirota bacterium]MBF0617086.1 NIL domain-containing protein [Nitrospirota bacterium]